MIGRNCKACKYFKWKKDPCDDSCPKNCGPWYVPECKKGKFKVGAENWDIDGVEHRCFVKIKRG